LDLIKQLLLCLLGTATTTIFSFSLLLYGVPFSFLPFIWLDGGVFHFFRHGPLFFSVSSFVLLSAYLGFTPFLLYLTASCCPPLPFSTIFSFFFKKQRREKSNEITIYRSLLYIPYSSLV